LLVVWFFFWLVFFLWGFLVGVFGFLFGGGVVFLYFLVVFFFFIVFFLGGFWSLVGGIGGGGCVLFFFFLFVAAPSFSRGGTVRHTTSLAFQPRLLRSEVKNKLLEHLVCRKGLGPEHAIVN